MDAPIVTRSDEDAVAALFAAFAAGWNAHDGTACAAPFAADADFTAITGLRARGRELIARGHAEILGAVYRDTRLSVEPLGVRFLRADVALAEAHLHVRQADGRAVGSGPSLASVVAVKESGRWAIAAFRNMVPFQRAPAGPLERALLHGATPAAG
jgi:uncharacterized protein (TIGR02246 family)